MRIKITVDDDYEEEARDLYLTTESLDNLNFVECEVFDKEFTFSLDDMLVALHAFEEARKRTK